MFSDDPHSTLDAFLPFVALDNKNVFSYVCLSQGVARQSGQEQVRPPTVMKTNVPGERKCGVSTIRISGLREGIQKLIRRIRALHRTLFCGLEISVDPRDIRDEFNNEAAGWGVRSEISGMNEIDVKCVLAEHCQSTGQYFVTQADGSVELSIDQAERWLRRFDEVQELTLLLVHLVSGMPARGGELATYSVVNGDSCQRTLYVVGDLVFFMPHYNKTRSMTQKLKVIARFLDPKSSKLILQDICFLRPFAALLCRELGRGDGTACLTAMFIRKGAAMTDAQIRNSFKIRFSEFFGAPVSFQEYRHLAASYAWDVGIQPESFGVEEGFEDDPVIARQFGHSGETSLNVYGRHSKEFYGQRDVLLNQFRELCALWQRFLNISQDSVGLSTDQSIMPPSAVSDGSVAALTEQSSLVPLTRPAIHASDLEFNFSWSPWKLARLDPSIEPQRTLQAIRILRELVKVEGVANFRSNHQKLAVEYSVFSERDLVIVLGTGQGKSLTFFSYAKAHPGKTAVVVVPLVSLQADMMNRAREHGISSAAQFEPERSIQLYFWTPEYAMSSIKFLADLSLREMLGRIFIDEAHLLITGADFRPCLRELCKLSTFGAPLTLLSGTVSKSCSEALTQLMFPGARPPMIIRGSTDRPNLEYEVILGNTMASLLSVLRKTIPELEVESRVLVYVTSVQQDLSIVVSNLRENNFLCSEYYADMSVSMKRQSVERWKSGQTPIMVATSAFGLGIDHGTVRLVALYGLPYSIDELVQQWGRAGRDGISSRAVLLVDQAREIARHQSLTDASLKTSKAEVLDFAIQRSVCRRRYLTAIFDDCEGCCFSVPAAKCDICRDSLITRRVPASTRPAPPESMGTRHAQAVLASEIVLGGKLMRYLDVFKTNCILCFCHAMKLEPHAVEKCWRIRSEKLCRICYTRCNQYTCPWKNWSPDGHCNRCFLAAEMFGQNIHGRGQFGSPCPNPSETLKAFFGFSFQCDKSGCAVGGHGALKLHHAFIEFLDLNLS